MLLCVMSCTRRRSCCAGGSRTTRASSWDCQVGRQTDWAAGALQLLGRSLWLRCVMSSSLACSVTTSILQFALACLIAECGYSFQLRRLVFTADWLLLTPLSLLLCAVDGSSLPVVRPCDIEAVVSAWSGVPVERLTEDEMTKLVRLVGARLADTALSTRSSLQLKSRPSWMAAMLADPAIQSSKRMNCKPPC